jgi:hypothetical protein
MIRKRVQYLRGQIGNTMRYIEWLNKKDLHESVFFYTFHKCASTLFSSYVLKNVEGLRHVDYASKIYFGNMVDDASYNDTGFIYGPFRLSLRHTSPVYIKLVKNASDPEFIRHRIAIFLIRDPRDILVSQYFSFGFTHGFSPVKEIRELQQQIRSDIQTKSIDQYCIEEASKTLDGFKTAWRLNQSSSRSVILKYEDMIVNWDVFSEALTKYIDLKSKVLAQIYKRTRPVEKEDLTSHRRDGRPGSFRHKLQKDTIEYLNEVFMDVLKEHQYSI